MKTSECLGMVLYEPIKYIANSGNGSEELVNFCRLIISKLEDNSDWNFADFEKMYGKRLRTMCRNLIKELQTK